MTDWERMKEQIDRAMKSAAEQNAESILPAEVYADILDDTRAELIRLETKLKRLQWALDNPGQYSMDEIFEILSRLIGGRPAGYRKSQRLQDQAVPEEKIANDIR